MVINRNCGLPTRTESRVLVKIVEIPRGRVPFARLCLANANSMVIRAQNVQWNRSKKRELGNKCGNLVTNHNHHEDNDNHEHGRHFIGDPVVQFGPIIRIIAKFLNRRREVAMHGRQQNNTQ